MNVGWEKRKLGRSGLEVSAIGLGSSYGLSGNDVERAFERGINYLYWGSRRRASFGQGIRNVAKRRREGLVVTIQSYARAGFAMRWSLESALRRLDIEYADLLLLGWWNHLPPDRILDTAMALREAGKIRGVMISCHHRPSFASYANDERCSAIMVRYNAAHRGAEREVFPALDARPNRPGVCAYTATRWGALLDASVLPPNEKAPRASDCYRFSAGHPSVDMCLAGPKDGRELDEAIAALDRGPLDPDELAWMQRVGDAVHATKGLEAARVRARIWGRMVGATSRNAHTPRD